ncbi:MAG: putative colanic acid biosynthesis acetyltransferase [Chloroflexota bacterium]|nr:putative colanic acid biosynthesis acetyltransferase [Chloroflexota bacterium]
MKLDIAGARAARPYMRTEYAGRIAWALATPLFRFSPKPLYGSRRLLLRVVRASVGRDVRIDPSARIEIPRNLTIGDHASIGADAWVYNLGPVSIGARATVSHLAHLCAGTHDYELPSLPLLRLGIDIGPDAWICAEAFLGPAIRVGAGAVVAARAVAVRDVPPWTVVAGNPASAVKPRTLRDGGAP